MAENRNSQLDRRQLERSLALLSDGATEPVLNVLNEVALDSRQWEAAVADPPQFLRDRGIDLPDGVEVLLGTGTRERPFPPPEIELELVVIRTFWWCTRSPGEPQTCLRVNLEVPKALINWSGAHPGQVLSAELVNGRGGGQCACGKARTRGGHLILWVCH